MLELYNDRLIDLLAPHGKDVSFDKKKKSNCKCYVYVIVYSFCELISLHKFGYREYTSICMFVYLVVLIKLQKLPFWF